MWEAAVNELYEKLSMFVCFGIPLIVVILAIGAIKWVMTRPSSKPSSHLTEGRITKGGHNPPNTSSQRPPAPRGSVG